MTCWRNALAVLRDEDHGLGLTGYPPADRSAAITGWIAALGVIECIKKGIDLQQFRRQTDSPQEPAI
jgi:hypothetical protein